MQNATKHLTIKSLILNDFSNFQHFGNKRKYQKVLLVKGGLKDLKDKLEKIIINIHKLQEKVSKVPEKVCKLREKVSELPEKVCKVPEKVNTLT